MIQRDDQLAALEETLRAFNLKWGPEAVDRMRRQPPPFEPNRIRPLDPGYAFQRQMGALEARKGPDGVWTVD